MKSNNHPAPPIDAMSVLGRLSMSLTHEINNSLTVALSNTQLLLMDLDSDSPLFDLAQETHAAHQQIKTLIQNFSDIGNQTPNRQMPTNLAEVIDDALNLVAYPFRRAQIAVTCNYQSAPIIMANRNLLKLALTQFLLYWSSPAVLNACHPTAITVHLAHTDTQFATLTMTLSTQAAEFESPINGPELRGIEAVVKQHHGQFSLQHQADAICCTITLPEDARSTLNP